MLRSRPRTTRVSPHGYLHSAAHAAHMQRHFSAAAREVHSCMQCSALTSCRHRWPACMCHQPAAGPLPRLRKPPGAVPARVHAPRRSTALTHCNQVRASPGRSPPVDEACQPQQAVVLRLRTQLQQVPGGRQGGKTAGSRAGNINMTHNPLDHASAGDAGTWMSTAQHLLTKEPVASTMKQLGVCASHQLLLALLPWGLCCCC